MARKSKQRKIARSSATKKNLNSLLVIGLGVMLLAGLAVTSQLNKKINTRTKAAEWNPKIRPSDFTTNITNKYLTLPRGKRIVYKKETEDGLTERVVIRVTDKTKKVALGVETLVYRDKVWLDADDDGDFSQDELIEDTKDYLAQNRLTGDVWYFGEDVKNYEDGVFVGNDGSWQAGVDGALPGIWYKANPNKGDRYYQEYYVGEAEDQVRVVATDASVSVPYGSYRNCVKTFDFTRLDPSSLEYKYYCENVGPGGGALVLAESLAREGKKLVVLEKEELVKVEMNTDDEDDD